MVLNICRSMSCLVLYMIRVGFWFCVSKVSSPLLPVGVLLRGSLLQCHHQLEPLLLLPVLPATSAMA